MAFTQIVMAVNRTTVKLEVMENGMVWEIPPGYVVLEDGSFVGAGVGGRPLETPLPYFVAERAMRHNPIMGTSDPLNPGRALSLVGVPAWGNDVSHVEQSDAIEILDRRGLPAAEVMRAIGGRKTTRIPGRQETVPHDRSLRTGDLVIPELHSPVGELGGPAGS